MHNQTYLNYYFKDCWKPNLDAYQYSSYEKIATKVQSNEWLLDVGCGTNPFKKLLANVVGVDPARDEADHICTIEEFEPTFKFDIATCLGSINFGSEEVIANQIRKLVSCLKPDARIYWRLNPGRNDHNNAQCKSIVFYPWTHEKLLQFAKLHGFIQQNEQIESNGVVIRLYAEWSRGL